MPFRLPLQIIVAIALQAVGLFIAGCTSRTGSPTRVDEGACASQMWSTLAATGPDGVHDLLDREIAAFAQLDRQLATARQALLVATVRARSAASDGRPIPAASVEELNRGFAVANAVVQEIATVAARHAIWAEADAKACADHGLRGLDPALRIEGAGLSVAASLSLYDSYALCGAVLAEDDAIRRILNRGDQGFGLDCGQLDGLTRDYLSLIRRSRVHDAIGFLDGCRAQWEGNPEKHLAWLRATIRASPSWAALRSSSFVPLGVFTGSTFGLIESDLKLVGDSSLGGASKGFGNAVGAISFRRGLLADRADLEAQIRARLQPGDILLEKTPFRLTDRLIPGHWGHAAIWLGDEADLRRLGVWNEPLMQPHRAAVGAGKLVAEALRSGVQLNTLAHFLDIDDLCVLRAQPGLSDAELAEHLRRCLRQLGKDYDFNFDVETADTIVCSELVYQVYTGMTWPTGKALGRYTISPDQVAVRALDGGPLTVVDLWHDGRQITGDRQAALIGLLSGTR